MALMSFKFSEFHSSYLKNVIKGSDMTMTDYLEMLIDTNIDAQGDNFGIALVLQGDVLKFCKPEDKSNLIVESVTGEKIRAFITDNQSSEIVSAFKLIMNSELCETPVNLTDEDGICGDTRLMLTSGEAAEEKLKAIFDFDIKEAIWK